MSGIVAAVGAPTTLPWELGRDGTCRELRVGRGIDTPELMRRATLAVFKGGGV